jgi:ABC-type transport system substrate-binding protein
LKRPQLSFLALLASGLSPVYPCHISPAEMRQHPIGTGPFKFVEFKPNQSIKMVRNPDYWKPGRPYLDGIEYTIIPNRSTAMLAFAAGQFDLTFPYEITIAMLRDLRSQIDSMLEGAGFELLVPASKRTAVPRARPFVFRTQLHRLRSYSFRECRLRTLVPYELTRDRSCEESRGGRAWSVRLSAC